VRNPTISDIRLHPSTVASTFEEAMATGVLPDAGDPLQHPDTLFVRSLYRQADESFPLRDDTLAQLAAAGGDVVEALAYQLVATVPGPDPARSDAPSARTAPEPAGA
jgi:hypothetical protein